MRRNATLVDRRLYSYVRHWAYHARSRCRNPRDKSYFRYGARGVEFCFASPLRAAQWVVENLGPRPSPSHSVDRIKNGGHYEAGNLRWATRTVQSRNTRRNVIKSLEHAEFIRGLEAEGYDIVQIACSQGISKYTVLDVLRYKTWLPEAA
jgi:hypothetical protein